MEWIFTPYDRVIMRNFLGNRKVRFIAGRFGSGGLHMFRSVLGSGFSLWVYGLVHRSDCGWICVFLYGVLAEKRVQ